MKTNPASAVEVIQSDRDAFSSGWDAAVEWAKRVRPGAWPSSTIAKHDAFSDYENERSINV